MKLKTALVIGGGKFLGRHIVSRLLADGYKTTILTRGHTPHPFEGLVEWLKCDRNDHVAFDELLYRRAFDYVIDVISYNAGQAKHAADFFFGRTSRFVHISSGAVYLLNPERLNPLRESDAPSKLEPSMMEASSMHQYGYHKREGELEIEKAIEAKGFPGVILRMPVISGKYDYTLRDYSYIKRIIDGGPIVAPAERRGAFRHVYVGDVVDAVMLALTSRDVPGKAFNIASHTIFSFEDYIGIIARAVEEQVEIVYFPHEFLHSRLGRGYSHFAYPHNFILDMFSAQCALGFKPSRAEKWLTELARYYVDEYIGDLPDGYPEQRRKELELVAEMKKGDG